MAAEDVLELSVILGEPSTSEEHDLSGGYQFLVLVSVTKDLYKHTKRSTLSVYQ